MPIAQNTSLANLRAYARSWLIGAAAHTRRLSAVEAGPGPDLAEQILAAAGVTPITRRRRQAPNTR